MPIDLRPYYRLGEFPEERFKKSRGATASGRATIRRAPRQAKERLKAIHRIDWIGQMRAIDESWPKTVDSNWLQEGNCYRSAQARRSLCLSNGFASSFLNKQQSHVYLKRPKKAFLNSDSITPTVISHGFLLQQKKWLTRRWNALQKYWNYWKQGIELTTTVSSLNNLTTLLHASTWERKKLSKCHRFQISSWDPLAPLTLELE